MNPIFTEYVRSLDPGEEPEAESFAVLWSTLRGALCNEMRNRRLWQVHPSRLGVFGRASWSEPGAFEELTGDCYVYVFLERLPALKAQLRGKDNVEGLVFRNIRNFLHDVQKKNDPLGFTAYGVLRRAVRRLVDRGALTASDACLGHGTVLAFAGAGEGPPAERAELEPQVRRWCDELAVDLLAARGRRLAKVVRALAQRIAGLPAHGVAAVRFKDLVDLTIGAVRMRWYALRTLEGGETALEPDDDGGVRRVRTVPPAAGYEEREAFAKLCARVDGSLRRRRASAALRRLWDLLRRHAEGAGDERPPSHRQIARVLGVTRHQLAGLMAVLGRWVTELPAV